ncbi:hypothetical protein L6164_031966 [Bauhinia variegata]|uniref:Uncharacterized protein n=1 Tax=Bauhinia variegata TaxID=167791 RepID=A0ACB9KMK7_BAUVA|nr:hypothetical protein L6164_031966 [Bauhinia variegata]
MSAVVETWVGEFAKLREKVLARKRFLSKSKEGEGEENEAHNKKEKQASVQKNQRDSASSTMSEATVCLLMDRFVPC